MKQPILPILMTALLVAIACNENDGAGTNADMNTDAGADTGTNTDTGTGTDTGANAENTLVEYYQGWQEDGPAEAARLLDGLGGDFEQLSEETYGELVGQLDLREDHDLMAWGAVTGISIVVLERQSSLFAFNAHLIENRGGVKLSTDELYGLTTERDTETNELAVLGANGERFSIIDTRSTLARLETTCTVKHNKDFAPDRIHFETLSQYLHHPSEINNRDEIAEGISSFPFWFVRLLRGKAIYFSNDLQGPSLALGTPVGNEMYTYYAGMIPGVFYKTKHSPSLLVHEFCHTLDRLVILDGYGRYLYPYQYPGLHPFADQRDELFGPSYPGSPPDLPYGYISEYSRTTDLENFAEHCRAYITERVAFDALATEEENLGHDLLRRKYNFMQAVAEASCPHIGLTAEFIEQQQDSSCN